MSIRYILTLLLPYFACINGVQLPDLMVTGTENRSFEQYILAQLAAPADVIQACSGWLNTNRDLIDCALGYELMVGSVKPLMDVTHEVLVRKNLKNLSNFNYVFRIPQTQWVMKIAGHVNRKHNLNTLYHYVRYPAKSSSSDSPRRSTAPSSRFSRTVSWPNSRPPSGTIAIPRAIRCGTGQPVTSSRPSRTRPERVRTSPRIVLSVVDLPDAFPPSRQTSSPLSTCSEIPSRIRICP